MRSAWWRSPRRRSPRPARACSPTCDGRASARSCAPSRRTVLSPTRIGNLARANRPPPAVSAPIVLFIDRSFEVAPFAAALAGELDCRESVTAAERRDVVALVTGRVSVGAADAERYPALRAVVSCGVGSDHLDLADLRRR